MSLWKCLWRGHDPEHRDDLAVEDGKYLLIPVHCRRCGYWIRTARPNAVMYGLTEMLKRSVLPAIKEDILRKSPYYVQFYQL